MFNLFFILPLELAMAEAFDDLVLELAADAGEVRVIAGDAHKKMAVVLRVFLCVLEHIRVEHVYLQCGSSVFGIGP
jgi:hypothetical protein